MLQQALEVILNGQVEFGRVNQAKEIIKMKTLMVKTEQQTESVRTSPEYLRCTQEEHLEHPLAEVCELVRHQAASVIEVNHCLKNRSWSIFYDISIKNWLKILF